LKILLLRPGVSEGRVFVQFAGGGGVGIFFAWGLVGEGVMFGELVGLPGWEMFGLGTVQVRAWEFLAAE
jgi:hypothetical protein